MFRQEIPDLHGQQKLQPAAFVDIRLTETLQSTIASAGQAEQDLTGFRL